MIIYYNLTQMLALPNIINRWVYFRSTWVEQKEYVGLLNSVPDEMLFFMAGGKGVCVIDASKHRKGKIERIFIPTLKTLLEKLWLNKDSKIFCNEHVEIAWEALKQNNSLKSKYKFWKRLAIQTNNINLTGKTIKIEKELNI